MSSVLYRSTVLRNPESTVRPVSRGSVYLALLTFSATPVSQHTLRDAADHARHVGRYSGTRATTLRSGLRLDSGPRVQPAGTRRRDEVGDTTSGSAVFDFSLADRIVDFASAHGMKVRGHTLVWHRQNPPWLAEGHYTPEQLAQILEQHIKTVVGHYRGKVFAWDVINEAFDEPVQGRLRSTIWYDQPGIGSAQEGTAYIEHCFRWAHEADPDALLFYNEAEAETMNPEVRCRLCDGARFPAARRTDRRSRFRDAHQQSASRHGCRFPPTSAASLTWESRSTSRKWTCRFRSTPMAMPTPGDLKLQAEVYRQIATACLSHPGCSAIQTWGFTDKYSWIGSHSRAHTRGAALPFDANYQPKPAYEALRSALEQSRTVVSR